MKIAKEEYEFLQWKANREPGSCSDKGLSCKENCCLNLWMTIRNGADLHPLPGCAEHAAEMLQDVEIQKYSNPIAETSKKKLRELFN